MTGPAAKLTVITLGVRDVPASGRFYEALGFKRKMRKTGDEIVFLDGVGLVIALWDWNKLADDAIVEGEPRP
jgi:catechol 2,3-dioxygenase-like lactoylglutathione lyase family enzyme